jgi:maleylpyruvate isomerase
LVDAVLRQLNDQLDLATQRLLDAARVLPEPDLRAPSLLPGWSRAHVLAHVARNADAMRSLLIGARAQQQRSAYASAQARDDDIETSAAQASRELTTDLADSAMALRTMIRQLPDEAWSFRVQMLDSEPFPAAGLLTRRLVEVELHHCDLGIGYDAAKWPASFAQADLPEPFRAQRQERMSYPPQRYEPPSARASATPGPAQQRAMILRSLGGGPGPRAT